MKGSERGRGRGRKKEKEKVLLDFHLEAGVRMVAYVMYPCPANIADKYAPTPLEVPVTIAIGI